ncbi:MAG: helix-turn-helix transcriptional regulator [Leptolyngbyaceae cyanobacterium]
MAIELLLNHPDDWLQPESASQINLPHVSYTDTTMRCPQALGRGYRQCLAMRDGLSIVILDYEFHDDFVRKIQAFERPVGLELAFMLTGPNVGQSKLFLAAGREIASSIGRYPGHQRILKVELHLQLPMLQVFLDGLLEALPAPLKPSADEYFEKFYSRQIPPLSPLIEQAYSLASWAVITPQMMQVLQQILSCPYRGLNRWVYLEGKATELMTLRSQQIVEQLVSFDQQLAAPATLPPDELNRIYQAKELLLSDLQHPPSIPELAQHVNLNRRKLNESFQQVFHMTPFEYLQDYRLKQAQSILKCPDTKVEDVIQTVGYRSRSNFAVAFRKKFGLNPKLYQQQQLKGPSEKCVGGSQESALTVQKP